MTNEEFAAIQKPSELLRVAMNDLKKAEVDPNVRVDMGTWFDLYPRDGQKTCVICEAGACIRNGLTPKFDTEDHTYYFLPSDFPEEVRVRLLAINQLREGNIKSALSYMDFSFEDASNYGKELSRFMNPYRSETKAYFYADQEKLIADLEANGL